MLFICGFVDDVVQSLLHCEQNTSNDFYKIFIRFVLCVFFVVVAAMTKERKCFDPIAKTSREFIFVYVHLS